MKFTVINAVAFNVLWLVVLTQSLPVGLITAAAALALHAVLITRSEPHTDIKWLPELIWLAGVTALGWLIETAIFSAGILVLDPGDTYNIGLVPLWLLLLWTGFATLFRFGFVHLWRFKALMPLLGALALMSYLAGANLKEGVALASPLSTSLMVIGAYWALLLPLLVWIYRTQVMPCKT